MEREGCTFCEEARRDTPLRFSPTRYNISDVRVLVERRQIKRSPCSYTAVGFTCRRLSLSAKLANALATDVRAIPRVPMLEEKPSKSNQTRVYRGEANSGIDGKILIPKPLVPMLPMTVNCFTGYFISRQIAKNYFIKLYDTRCFVYSLSSIVSIRLTIMVRRKLFFRKRCTFFFVRGKTIPNAFQQVGRTKRRNTTLTKPRRARKVYERGN